MSFHQKSSISKTQKSPTATRIANDRRGDHGSDLDAKTAQAVDQSVFTGENTSVVTRSEVVGDRTNNAADQVRARPIEDSLTDAEFVAQFKKISGATPVKIALRLAALCAKKKSFSAEKLTLENVGLSSSKFSKYAAIGRDRRFDEIRSRFPDRTGFSVLYAMSLLTDDQWKEGFHSGAISPESTRVEVEAFRTGIPKKARGSKPSQPYFAAVNLTADTSDENKAKIREALIALCEENNLQPFFASDEVR